MSEKAIEQFIYYGKAVIILIAGLIIIGILQHLTKRWLKKSRLDESVHAFILNVEKIILWIILIVVIISYFGVPTAPFVTVIGACGAAIALALKDSLANVAGGIIILFTHPFDKGDFIDIGKVSGYVEKIDILTTTLKTRDNKVITAPNGQINTSMITNWDRADIRRVDCGISIGYNDDTSAAKEALKELAENCPYALDTPPPLIGVSEHGESSIDFDYGVWCKTEDYWNTKYYLEENAVKLFSEKGITIPYPQVEVHVKDKKDQN